MNKLFLLLLAGVFLCGCEEDQIQPPQKDTPNNLIEKQSVKEIEKVKEKEPKAPPIAATQEQAQALVAGNNAFAFEIFKTIAPEGNFVFSPYSISFAMGLATVGAAGKTASELQEVLAFPDQGELLAKEFNLVYDKTVSQAEGFQFACANSLWLNENFKLNESYQKLVQENFHGEAETLPFDRDSKKSADRINSWISDNTLKLIQNLLTPEQVGGTRLILVNAVSFLAKWESYFEARGTHDQNFRLENGTDIKVPLMYRDGTVAFGRTNGVLALEMNYRGGKYSMLVLMPEEVEKFRAFEKDLDAEKLNLYLSSIGYENAKLFFPKFEISWGDSLVASFQKLGLNLPFSGGADFSGLTTAERLYISDIIHRAVIKVDEEGTKAAAVTAIMAKATAIMRQEIVRINKPFVYLIREKETGSILFLGHFTGLK